MKKWLFHFSALLVLLSCNNNIKKNNTGTRITGIDSLIKPGNNFFMYVNRKWYDTAQIPLSQAGVGAYAFMVFV